MKAQNRLPVVIWVVLGALAALFMGWGLAPDSPLYVDLLTPRVLLALASVAKMTYLLSGALLAFACRDRLEAGNAARPAWALLSAGLFATFAGQMCLAPFQLVQGHTPFPSVADVFYLLAYPFLIAAFLVFMRAYRESGFPTGSLAERLGILAVVGISGGTAAVIMLRPVAMGGGDLLERILNVAYPALDLVLLLPLALLVRMALRMRGSQVGAVWSLLLAGFVFLVFSDTAFAYFSLLGEELLDPYVHASYVLSYGLIAAGAHRQLLLLRS